MHLSQLCSLLGAAGLTARLQGADRLVTGVNSLDDAADGELSFLSNAKYTGALARTKASAVLADEQADVPERMSAIRCTDPYAAVAVAITEIHGPRRHPTWGIHERATIDASAKIGDGANIGAGATVAADVTIGERCTIYPGCYIGDQAELGDDCTLYPNVVIYDRTRLGDRVTIHAGSVIGEDGLGYAPSGDSWKKIPQIGRTVIGNDVEIGANCCVDRATVGQTEIGAGTKFGNEVVIGHGTKVGPDCLFVGQVGVAGSVTVGRHVTLAGQVGVAGHLTIGDNVRVGGQSGVKGDVEAGTEVFGSPAIPIAKAKRAIYAVERLPDLMQRVKDLERELAELRERLRD